MRTRKQIINHYNPEKRKAIWMYVLVEKIDDKLPEPEAYMDLHELHFRTSTSMAITENPVSIFACNMKEWLEMSGKARKSIRKYGMITNEEFIKHFMKR